MHSAFTGVMLRPRRPLLLSLAEEEEETEDAEDAEDADETDDAEETEEDEELELTEEELEELLSARTMIGTIRPPTRKSERTRVARIARLVKESSCYHRYDRSYSLTRYSPFTICSEGALLLERIALDNSLLLVWFYCL